MEDKHRLMNKAGDLQRQTRNMIDRMLNGLCSKEHITKETLQAACKRLDDECQCPFGHRVPGKSIQKHTRKCLKKRLDSNVQRKPQTTEKSYKNIPGVITVLRPTSSYPDASTATSNTEWESIDTPFGKLRRKLGLNPQEQSLVFEVKYQWHCIAEQRQILEDYNLESTSEGEKSLHDKELALFKYLRDNYGVHQKSEVDRLDEIPNILKKIKKDEERERQKKMTMNKVRPAYRANTTVQLRRKTHTAIARDLIAAMMRTSSVSNQPH
ncbi:hypothetical protein BC829DRAFT_379486 [Chytridium lagenaria]|nr:hypothetical protein BC829DRAFT_379486 [Chytridium lagenaria]